MKTKKEQKKKPLITLEGLKSTEKVRLPITLKNLKSPKITHIDR